MQYALLAYGSEQSGRGAPDETTRLPRSWPGRT